MSEEALAKAIEREAELQRQDVEVRRSCLGRREGGDSDVG